MPLGSFRVALLLSPLKEYLHFHPSVSFPELFFQFRISPRLCEVDTRRSVMIRSPMDPPFRCLFLYFIPSPLPFVCPPTRSLRQFPPFLLACHETDSCDAVVGKTSGRCGECAIDPISLSFLTQLCLLLLIFIFLFRSLSGLYQFRVSPRLCELDTRRSVMIRSPLDPPHGCLFLLPLSYHHCPLSILRPAVSDSSLLFLLACHDTDSCDAVVGKMSGRCGQCAIDPIFAFFSYPALFMAAHIFWSTTPFILPPLPFVCPPTRSLRQFPPFSAGVP